MRATHNVARLAAFAATVAVLLVATPAGAVVGGTTDTANRYANVGVLQLRDGADWFDFCSGTLVRPDVVLTAAHCTDFLVEEGPDGLGPDDLRISFDPEGDAPYATVDHIVVHPDWFTAAPGRGNSKHLYLAPPAEDIALVFLDASVAGITPAPIAGADYLTGLDLTAETFTVVGYGVDRFITAAPGRGNSKRLYLAPPAEDIALVFLDAPVAGITPAPIADADYVAGLDLTAETFTVVGYGVDRFITGSLLANHPVVLVDGVRSYRDVSVITKHDAFPDRFLKITQSVCFGDSGGPLLHEGTVVALNTWTFSTRCSGPNLEYRVDSQAAQSFLEANL